MSKLMKAIDCIERLIDDSGLYGNPSLTNDAINSLMYIKDVLEKQVEKKPKSVNVFRKQDVDWDCPSCGYAEACDMSNRPNYCRCCGQRLMWV